MSGGEDPLIRASGLRYRYRGAGADALRGLSFDVRRGEIFGFLGPSGAGKSTTQRVLTGLLTGYSGELRVFGRSLAELGRSFYERIGVSFEVPNVYGKLSGRENLELFAALFRGRSADPLALLEMVGLGDAAEMRAEQYSKGMRMRLNFCRALLRDPELLFLDEPTTGQDPENARRLRNIIRERRSRGTTVFLSTHDMAVAAELCDRVAFIVEGAIAVVDRPQELMLRHGQRRVVVEVEADGTVLREEFELDGLASDDGFLRTLGRGTIRRIHTLDATLEDVFLQVTGRELT
jgi:fluoroquinolone transport system ATP-binding protein